METIRKVRKAHFVDGKGIREIARTFNLARNTYFAHEAAAVKIVCCKRNYYVVQ